MGKRATAKVQTKKKRWVAIHATGPYDGHLIGETYVSEPADKIGQKLMVSLAAMTGENNRQNLQLKFIINKVHEGALYAGLIGSHMLESTLKKLVRKNKNKLDLSFIVKTQDKQPVRVKVLCTTRNKTTGIVLTKLVKRIIYKTNKSASEQTFDQFVRSILARNFQKDLQAYLKKTYPVAVCEVRDFELLNPSELKEADITAHTMPVEPDDESEESEDTEPLESDEETAKPTTESSPESEPEAVAKKKRKTKASEEQSAAEEIEETVEEILEEDN